MSDDISQDAGAQISRQRFVSGTLAKAKENPWTVFFGAISFFLALYAIYDAKNEPDLQVLFDPGAATKIVTALNPDIEVRYKGVVVAGEVSSQVIRIWNAGKRPIEGQDVLKQFQIKASPDVTILDARIKQQTRDVIAVVPTIVDKSTLNISWKILENDDGAALQLIFQGPFDSKFSVDGAIRGQKTIRANFLSPSNAERNVLKAAYRKLVDGWSPLARFLTALFLLVVLIAVSMSILFGAIYVFITYFAKWLPGIESLDPKWWILFVFLLLATLLAVESGYVGSLTTAIPASIR